MSIPKVENPGEKGYAPAYKAEPDVAALAADLKQRGYTREQITSMADKLPLNKVMMGELLSLIPASESGVSEEALADVQESLGSFGFGVEPEREQPLAVDIGSAGIKEAASVSIDTSVQVPALSEGFFSHTVQDTTFFDQAPVSKPLPAHQAGERATLAVIAQTGGLEDIGLISRIKQELEVYGNSPQEQESRARTREDLKGPLTHAALQSADVTNPAQALEVVQATRDELKAIELRDEIADMIQNTVNALPVEAKNYDFVFTDIVNKTLADRTMSSIVDLSMKEQWDKTSGVDIVLDFAEAVFGGQIVTSRTFQTEVLDKLGLGSGSITEYVFKADDIQALHDYVRAGKNGEEQVQRLEEIIQIVNSTESPFGENIVYRMDILSNIRSELEAEAGGASLAAIDDILDATELGLLGKSLIKIIDVVGAKLFGSTAAAAKNLRPEDIEYLDSIIKQAVDSLNPNNYTAPKRVRVMPEVRENKGSLFDSLAVSNPRMLNQVMNAGADSGENIEEYLGITKEALATRVTPAGSSDSGVHYTVLEKKGKLDQISEFDYSSTAKTREEFDRLIGEHSISDVLTEEELNKGVMRSIKQIHELSGGVLHPQSSWEALDIDGDFLKARAIFGKTGEEGYDSLEQAEFAKTFLFSEAGTISARVKGTNGGILTLEEAKDIPTDKLEYFVDVEVEHQVTAKDVNPLQGKVDAFLPFHSYLVPFSSRIEKDLADSTMAYVDKASRLAGTMQKFTQPIGSLRGKMEREQWTRLLTHGDEYGLVFTKAAAKEYLGKMSDRVWDAYVGTRSFYDSMAIIRNKAHRAALTEQGYKGVRANNLHLGDEKGLVFGRPLPEPVGIEGNTLYDATTGKVVQNSEGVLTTAYQSDKIVIKNHRPIQVNGEQFDYSIVNRSEVTDLPHQTMNIRKGHIDLNYLGEDGFFRRYLGRVFGAEQHAGGTGAKILRKVQVTRNGLPHEYEEAVGIYRDTRQAEQARKMLGEGEYRVVSTREAVSELGVDDAGSKSNVPSHARGRGHRLLGPSGYAEISDVEDSIGRALSEARRYTGQDSVDILKSKFMATYGKYLEDAGNGFPTDFARTRWRQKDDPIVQGKIRDAKAYHSYIKNQEAALSGTMKTKWLEDLRASVDVWRVQGGEFQEFIGTAALSLMDTDFIKVGTQLSAAVFIAARPLYQILANAAQSAFLFAHNPVRFSTATVPRTIAVMAGLMLRDTRLGNVSLKVLGKTFGMKGDEFKTYLQQMSDSGMFSTGMVDDMFSLFSDNMKVAAGSNSVRSSEFWKSMLPGGGLGGRVMGGLIKPQKLSTDFSNLMAYVHATSGYKTKFKEASLTDAVARRTILGDARRLTFTQNSADQFTYQQNIASIQFQFMQHVHKMFLQLVADPTVNLATLGKKSVLRKGTNPWSGTFAQSFITLGTITAMFGLESQVGSGLTTTWTSALQEQGATPDMIDIVMDGVFGKVTESVYGTELDLASRFSPIGFVSTTLGLMFTEDGALNLGGPSGSLWKSMNHLAGIGKAFWKDSELSEEEGALLLNEASQVFAGLKDYQRYQIAVNMGEFRTTSGRKIADVTPEAAIPVLFSVPPKAVQRYYDTLDDIMSVQENVDAVVRSVNSYLLNEMNNEAWDAMTAEKVSEYMIKGFALVDSAFSSHPTAGREAKQKLAKEFIHPEKEFMSKYAEKIAVRLSPEDAVQRLTAIKQNNPEQGIVVDELIKLLQTQLEE